jgi:hypothetical protein
MHAHQFSSCDDLPVLGVPGMYNRVMGGLRYLRIDYSARRMLAFAPVAAEK